MASKWEETVMGDDAILERLGGHWENFLIPVWRESLLLTQAEITWHARDGEIKEAEKRGRQEVVDFVEEHMCNLEEWTGWQEQKEEWGIEVKE